MPGHWPTSCLWGEEVAGEVGETLRQRDHQDSEINTGLLAACVVKQSGSPLFAAFRLLPVGVSPQNTCISA